MEMLSVPRGAALYIGALLGPGLLLLPGLAAAQAGPASVLAWLALLGTSALLAVVFAALGTAQPGARGVAAYTSAGLGGRAGAAAGWCFLAGVVCGAPIVCLIGAGYVADLVGGGLVMRCAGAAVLLLVVLALALRGIRASARVQLALVAVLIVVLLVAVTGAAPSASTTHWAPFAPHGWTAVGTAAATLMMSFVGWEAVAPLTARFADPVRQLPRVIGIAFAVTTAIYLALAITVIGVLGSGSATDVPVADLLRIAIGPAGRIAAAVAAIVLTIGTTNAYLSGAAELAAALTSRPRRQRSARPLLVVIAVAGVALIGLRALHLLTTAELVILPTTLFLLVYLGCTVAAARTLTGRARGAAAAAAVAVTGVLAFTGWALAVGAAVALTAALVGHPSAAGPEPAEPEPAEPEGRRQLVPVCAAGTRSVTAPPVS
jgi:amino acid efflux transporter